MACRLSRPAISLALAVLMTAVVPLRADILPENSKRLERCVVIENTTDFPDYVLIVWHGSPFGGWTVIEPENCIRLDNKYARFALYAVPGASWQPDSAPSGDYELEKSFFEGSGVRAIPDDIEGSDTVPLDDPRVALRYRVALVDTAGVPTGLVTRAVETTYEDASAPSETAPDSASPTGGDSPSALARSGLLGSDLLWYLGVPIVALAAIAAITLRRRNRGRSR